jgi:hypothetical protein
MTSVLRSDSLRRYSRSGRGSSRAQGRIAGRRRRSPPGDRRLSAFPALGHENSWPLGLLLAFRRPSPCGSPSVPVGRLGDGHASPVSELLVCQGARTGGASGVFSCSSRGSHSSHLGGEIDRLLRRGGHCGSQHFAFHGEKVDVMCRPSAGAGRGLPAEFWGEAGLPYHAPA